MRPVLSLLLAGAALAGATLDTPPPDASRTPPAAAVGAGDATSAVADVSAAVTAVRLLSCRGRGATVVGTADDDVLTGDVDADVIVAGGGDDVVRSLGGDDVVCGGTGHDRIFGGPGRDRLIGGVGDDYLSGGHERDHLHGLAGNDLVVDAGGGYRDLLEGGPGDDWLRTPAGGYAEGKTLSGGPGADHVVNIGSSEGFLLGGPGPDTITSRGHNDFVGGGPGADVLTLSGGGDTVVGLDVDGNLVRVRGAGYVVLIPKDDVPGPLEVDLVAGVARAIGASSGDRIVDLSPLTAPVFFWVYGSDGDDVLTGRRTGLDFLYGGRGDDTCTPPDRGVRC